MSQSSQKHGKNKSIEIETDPAKMTQPLFFKLSGYKGIRPSSPTYRYYNGSNKPPIFNLSRGLYSARNRNKSIKNNVSLGNVSCKSIQKRPFTARVSS